jgi:hypothetical protein
MRRRRRHHASEIAAELIDRTRKLIARQNFTAVAHCAGEFDGGRSGLSVASTKVLDDLVAWLETKSASATLAGVR